MSHCEGRKLDDWGTSGGINTFTSYLLEEPASEIPVLDKQNPKRLSPQFIPRQVYHSHFTYVKPEPVPSPYSIATSKSCAEMLGLDPTELTSDRFLQAFVGNELLPGLDRPWCSVYGCHCYGHWFGQLGDGRAMSIGEVATGSRGGRYELQLKGSGRSPFSRSFDGRAVLRSSIREYLVSEAMYNLGVATTRALCVLGTGQTIRRPWYSALSGGKDLLDPPEKQGKENKENRWLEEGGGSRKGAEGARQTPDVLLQEPGAILCRVSPTFVRFGQLELFGQRNEMEELVQLTNYAILREFPHLISQYDSSSSSSSTAALSVQLNSSVEYSSEVQAWIRTTHSPQLYMNFMKEVAKQTARLVSEWLRVGYVQGNMNSDNTLIAGRTLDYGPYGWMEKFDPFYQPFTSDAEGKFAFIRQPTAMNVNVKILSETISLLVHHATKKTSTTNLSSGDLSTLLENSSKEISRIASEGFEQSFWSNYNEARRKKLGWKSFDEKSGDGDNWALLERLMFDSNIDFTIFWRELSNVGDCVDAGEALTVLEPAFYSSTTSSSNQATSLSSDLIERWTSWLNMYLERLQSDNRNPEERKKEMRSASPKFVLRNWMSVLAYESAAKGDYSLIEEINDVLSHPYDEQSPEVTAKWYSKAPNWARGMPGVAFMS